MVVQKRRRTCRIDIDKQKNEDEITYHGTIKKESRTADVVKEELQRVAASSRDGHVWLCADDQRQRCAIAPLRSQCDGGSEPEVRGKGGGGHNGGKQSSESCLRISRI